MMTSSNGSRTIDQRRDNMAISIDDINEGMRTGAGTQRNLGAQDARDWIGNTEGVISLSEFDGIAWPIPVERVEITSGNWNHAGAVGVTHQITHNIIPSNATIQGVTYESSNPAVASVSPTGLVTALATGSATITVTPDDPEGAPDTMTATVSIQAPYTLTFADQIIGDGARNERTSTIYSQSNAISLRLNAGQMRLYSVTPPSGTGDIDYQCRFQYRINGGGWIVVGGTNPDTNPNFWKDSPHSSAQTRGITPVDVWSGVPSLVEVRIIHYTGDRTSGSVGYCRANPAFSGNVACAFTGIAQTG
jgi:hypothetical protein